MRLNATLAVLAWTFAPPALQSPGPIQFTDAIHYPGPSAWSGSPLLPPGGQGLVTSDLNLDGLADVVVAHTSGVVGAWISEGDGAFLGPFASQVTGGTWLIPWAMDVAPLDADAFPDLVIGRFGVPAGASPVAVLTGDGAGSFFPWLYPQPTAGPTSIATGDFDVDGDVDIMVTSGPTSGDVTLGLQINLAGSGFAPVPFPCFLQGSFNPVAPPVQTQLRDVNLDGVTDYIVGGPILEMWLGTGTGCFLPVNPYWGTVEPPTVGGGKSFAWGDFDGNGSDDLVVVAEGSTFTDDVALYLWGASGSPMWSVTQTFSASGFPSGVSTGDFDLDGDTDFVISKVTTGTPSNSGNRLEVFENLGAGASFQQHVLTGGIRWNPGDVTAEDVNADGWPDLVFYQHGIPGTQVPGFAVVVNAGGFSDLELIGSALLGRQVHLYIRATASVPWLLMAGPNLGPPIALPGFTGAFLLDTSIAFPVAGGVLPSDGNTLLPITIPLDPTLVGATAYFQHASFDPGSSTGNFSSLLSVTVN
ncbi:MAG: VCBS repeat-containing protein [Planctomycetes bacterium]|nr:VCBS repeat-containing protein [Planctomycetota bacterium]